MMRIDDESGVLPATDMQKGLSGAVAELRARLKWTQADLAHALSREGTQTKVIVAPDQTIISKWERGQRLPSRTYRMALGRIAERHKHDDLAVLFRAPAIGWKVASALRGRAEVLERAERE